MPSQSLRRWLTSQRAELDRFETALRAARASQPASRQQLTDAYLMLVAAHFQFYCRSLHTEAVRFAAAQVVPPALSRLVEESLISGRRLDRGNAQPAALAADFERLGLQLWRNLVQLDSRNRDREQRLHQLNGWRNAVAHQDFDRSPAAAAAAAGAGRSLSQVRGWRQSCSALASQLDIVVGHHMTRMTGRRPW